ncbi:hypothetical protein FRC04_003366 [Tulasnella sp. 424]|nr:hypothetical protein FRC04_003366 [Tulasnella sp. 424]KAG8977181.1 hypothetical protein FRC05_002180 [Tulasnella sp. 425]
MHDFDGTVERCAEDVIKSFINLNGPGTGMENTFGDISAMLDKFNDFRAAIATAVSTKASRWLRRRNSLAPIHKLPIEIIQSIFRHMLFASSGRRRRRFVARLQALRSTSSLWRELIDRTPSFWVQLSSEDHIHFVSEALQKSQNLTLQLKYLGKFGNEPTSSPFLEKAFVHLDRWEYVAIQEPHGILVEKYFTTPAPRLKGMVLSTQMGFVEFGPSPPGLLFGGNLANLEEFRAVRWKDMNWADVHCHRLTVLEIEDYFWLDMETLFGIIAENMDLRILRMHFITFSEYTHPPRSHEPLVLPRLTDVTITNIAELTSENHRQSEDVPVMRMLQRLRFPACVSFTVEIGVYGVSDVTPEDFFRLIPRPIEIFTRGGGQVSRSKPPVARVKFWPYGIGCEAFGNAKSSPKYSMVLNGAHRSAGVEWTRRELVDVWTETKPDLQLRYWVDDERTKMDDILDLQDLVSVVELEVDGSPRFGIPEVSGVAQRLGTPVISASGTITGPFLRLRTLRLSKCAIDGKELLRMAKERGAWITNVSSEGDGEQQEANAAIGGGLSIILGEGMKKFSKTITRRDILAAPGIKDIKVLENHDSQLVDEHDGSLSTSSQESDWSPNYPESDEDRYGDTSSDAETVDTGVTPPSGSD